MSENTSTCPSGEIGMIRMMVKGMNVSTSRAVRRSDDTSRGLSVPPSAARIKRRPALFRSEPSSRTPQTIKSTASRTLSRASAPCSCSRVTLKPGPPNTTWSITPTRMRMSGISPASFSNSSSPIRLSERDADLSSAPPTPPTRTPLLPPAAAPLPMLPALLSASASAASCSSSVTKSATSSASSLASPSRSADADTSAGGGPLISSASSSSER
mmetsp:Transcript_39268/g.116819  ORF Transcript_39268/g.116819 Transcript_39268/m.116819 type:complete len:214 (+) Transcript_39268:3778-4419(+)